MKMGEKKEEKTKSLLQLTQLTCRWLNEYLKKNVSIWWDPLWLIYG